VDYKYCPSCGTEYRARFDICADCNVALTPQPPVSAEPPEEPTGPVEYSARALAAVFASGRHSEAEMVRGFLEAQGVEAEVWSTGLSPGHAAAGVSEISGVPSDFGAHRVMVPEESAEEAKMLLASIDQSEEISTDDGFEEAEADAVEPLDEEDDVRLDSALDFLRQRWAILAFALAFLLIVLIVGGPN
jgi:Putative prokaryotic signal transducing protein